MGTEGSIGGHEQNTMPENTNDRAPLISALELEGSISGRSEAGIHQLKGPRISPSQSWPKQIFFIMGNEVCERFSFYGIRAILVVHMTDNLYISVPNAEAALHAFTAACYALPLLGAWIADNIIGKYAVVLYFSGFYCLGHAALALWESRAGLAVGLALISLGAGAIKPCVAAMVGDQFDKEHETLLSGVFAMFYWCINLGSFASMATTPLLLKYLGPSAAFSVPGLFMAIALAVFWAGRSMYILVPPSEDKSAGFVKGFWDVAADSFTAEEVDGARAVAGLLKILACLSMFQALYDQHSSTWVIQAKHMDLNLLGWSMPPEQMQALNPILVLTLIPLFEACIYPATSKLFRVELTPLRKMSFGMVLAGFSFLYVAGIQIPAYLILTSSEVLVSTTGLQFAYTQAPESTKSTIMSLWLLTVFFGNLLDAILTKADLLSGLAFFLVFASLMFTVAVLFIWAAVLYKMRECSSETDIAKALTAVQFATQ